MDELDEPEVSCEGHTGAVVGYDYCNGPAGEHEGSSPTVMFIRGPNIHGLVLVKCVIWSTEPDTCYFHDLCM